MVRWSANPYIGPELAEAFSHYRTRPNPLALPGSWYLLTLAGNPGDFLEIARVSSVRREEEFRKDRESREILAVGVAANRKEAETVLTAVLEDCFRIAGKDGRARDFRRILSAGEEA